MISPSGAIRRRKYDAAGQLTEVIDANGSATQYGYDNAGQLTTITDAKGAVTRLAYNATAGKYRPPTRWAAPPAGIRPGRKPRSRSPTRPGGCCGWTTTPTGG